MKFLIAGLGNIGEEYMNTRHNIGFEIADRYAEKADASYKKEQHAFCTSIKFKAITLILIKPTTYVNLSGKAVSYWLQKEKIPLEKLLVIVDDLALPFGALRMRNKGGDGGHNGLKSISATLANINYCRLRFGIGNEFTKGRQVDYVLGKWSKDESSVLSSKMDKAIEMIQSFTTIGAEKTMSLYNSF